MALWNSLGQAATVAQLAGMDAAGLVTMIVQAVQTVQRNKVECQLLLNQVIMISGLLQQLQQSETMQRQEIMRPLVGLEDTLRQAYMLVTSCQQSNVVYRFFMAGNQAQQFRDVRERIGSYLLMYPMISHLDTRYFITGLYSRTHPSVVEPQDSEEMLGSSASHLNPESGSEGRSSAGTATELGGQEGAEPLAVAVQQSDGYANAEVLPKRRQRFKWLLWWAPKKASTSRSIKRVISHARTGCFAVFKLAELAASSNNFAPCNIIGQGFFGKTFKGVLLNGVNIAIKMALRTDTFILSQFETEVLIAPKLQHANIVKILGCCVEGGNMILVYEYHHNGSLLDKINAIRGGVPLSWPIRFRIIEGIVQGIVYLNHHSRPHVVHRDLKPGNIVLDCDMNPKIIDFGNAVLLSSDEDEIQDCVVGTLGYFDFEYAQTGRVSIQNDVYAFGVTLLKLITTQRPIATEVPKKDLLNICDLPCAWELWSSGRAMELIDSSLHGEPRMRDILRCLQIALLCVQEKRVSRPTMSDVLVMLKCESMALPAPRPPAKWPWAETSGSNTFSSTEESLSYFSCRSSDADVNDTEGIVS